MTESPYRSAWVSIGFAAVVLTTVPLALRIEDARQAVLAEAAVLICYLGILRATITFSGGLEGLFASRSDRASTVRASGAVEVPGGKGVGVGIFVILPAAAATAAAYFALRGLRHESRRARLPHWRVSWMVLAAAGLTMLTLLANPIANSRFISMAAIGTCLLAIVRPSRPRHGAWPCWPSLPSFRVSHRRCVSPGGGRGKRPRLHLGGLGGRGLDGFQQWVNTILYVQDNGHSFGTFTLSAIFFFAPRTPFPGHDRSQLW